MKKPVKTPSNTPSLRVLIARDPSPPLKLMSRGDAAGMSQVTDLTFAGETADESPDSCDLSPVTQKNLVVAMDYKR